MNFNQMLPNAITARIPLQLVMSSTDNLYMSSNYAPRHVIMYHVIDYGTPRLVNLMQAAVIVLSQLITRRGRFFIDWS